MGRLTTHVLDTARGRPADGIKILLYRVSGNSHKKIAEAVNWIGTAYLRMGDYDNAKKRLLEIPENHPDEIDLSLKAYANLIRYSRENRKTGDLESYVDDVQSYANRLVRQGKDQDYPLLYDRMVQIMTMGGKSAESKEWADAKPQ